MSFVSRSLDIIVDVYLYSVNQRLGKGVKKRRCFEYYIENGSVIVRLSRRNMSINILSI